MLIRTQPAVPLESCLGGLQTEAAPSCLGLDLGFRHYEESLQIQAQIVSRRKADSIPDCLLFVDYPPIITLGRTGKREHLLVGPLRH